MFCLSPCCFPVQFVAVAACTLELKIIPNAPCDEMVGWLGSALKVKVHAPALDGRANDALLHFLAKKLGWRRSAVALVRGEKSRQKLVRIDGLTACELKARVDASLAQRPMTHTAVASR